MRACISLGSEDFDRSIFQKHDFFEFRLDLADLRNLVPLAKVSIITNHKNPKSLEGVKSTYIDLDHLAPRIETDALVIRSYHDFNKTPPKTELMKFIHEPDDSIIKKVACLVRDEKDFDLLLSLFDERDNLVVIPMGDSKYRWIKTNSLWTYISFGKETAPGQIDFIHYLKPQLAN